MNIFSKRILMVLADAEEDDDTEYVNPTEGSEPNEGLDTDVEDSKMFKDYYNFPNKAKSKGRTGKPIHFGWNTQLIPVARGVRRIGT